jgi:hypothetical protein
MSNAKSANEEEGARAEAKGPNEEKRGLGASTKF